MYNFIRRPWHGEGYFRKACIALLQRSKRVIVCAMHPSDQKPGPPRLAFQSYAPDCFKATINTACAWRFRLDLACQLRQLCGILESICQFMRQPGWVNGILRSCASVFEHIEQIGVRSQSSRHSVGWQNPPLTLLFFVASFATDIELMLELVFHCRNQRSCLRSSRNACLPAQTAMPFLAGERLSMSCTPMT